MAAARTDRWFGLGWTALGIAIVVESWRMDRLEAQHINPWTVPGLVPGLLGVVLAGFGLVLAFRRAPAAEGEAAPAADEGWRILLGIALCIGFGAGLVGRLPFQLAAAAFVFLAILLFEWPERRAAGTLARGALRAAVVAVLSAAAIGFIFQEVFLVRLP